MKPAVIPRGAAVASKPWRLDELERGASTAFRSVSAPVAEVAAQPEQEVAMIPFPTVAELEALRSDGYREGVQKGKQEAQSQLVGEVESIAKALERIPSELAAIDAAYARFFSDAGTAIAAALEILPPEAMVDRIQCALATISRPESLALHLNPADVSCLRDIAPELLERDGMVVKESSEVGRGGFMIRSPFGSVDATLETMLQKLKKALRDA